MTTLSISLETGDAVFVGLGVGSADCCAVAVGSVIDSICSFGCVSIAIGLDSAQLNARIDNIIKSLIKRFFTTRYYHRNKLVAIQSRLSV